MLYVVLGDDVAGSEPFVRCLTTQGAERYRAGTNLVLLAPDVAHAFPTEEAVNQALRLVIQLAKIPTDATTSPSAEGIAY